MNNCFLLFHYKIIINYWKKIACRWTLEQIAGQFKGKMAAITADIGGL